MNFVTTAILISWLGIILLALVVAGLLRQVHALQGGKRTVVIGPQPGDSAPILPFVDMGTRTERVFLFVDTACRTCASALRLLDKSAESFQDKEFIAVFRNGAQTDLVSARHVSNQSAAFEQFHVPVTPFAVVVSEEGLVKRAGPIGSPAMYESVVISALTKEGASR